MRAVSDRQSCICLCCRAVNADSGWRRNFFPRRRRHPLRPRATGPPPLLARQRDARTRQQHRRARHPRHRPRTQEPALRRLRSRRRRRRNRIHAYRKAQFANRPYMGCISRSTALAAVAPKARTSCVRGRPRPHVCARRGVGREARGGAPGKPGCQDRPGSRMDRRRSDRRNPVSRRRNNTSPAFGHGANDMAMPRTAGTLIAGQPKRSAPRFFRGRRGARLMAAAVGRDPRPADRRQRQRARSNISPTWITPQS